MRRKVNIEELQKVTSEDFNKFGDFPRDSFDQIVHDYLIPDQSFTGFQVTQTATTEVLVANGNYTSNGRVYYNDTDGGVALQLLSVRPSVTRRYIAIVVWAADLEGVLTDLEPRTFLTDANTRATVARPTATESRRWANISTQAGVEGPDPQRPAIPSNYLAVAYVLMDSTGILLIEDATENRSPTLRGHDTALKEIATWRGQFGQRLDTLGTDITSLANRISGTARQSFAMMIAGNVARLNEKVGLPDAYTAWSADHFLDEGGTEVTHVDYLAKVEEGIRFPDAASHSAQLALQNQYDANVQLQDFFVLPAWDYTRRIQNSPLEDTELAVSQYAYQTINWTQKTRSRTLERFGPFYQVCANWMNSWSGGVYNYVTNRWESSQYDSFLNRFKFLNGEVWEVAPEDAQKARLGVYDYLRVRQVFVDTILDPYWDASVTSGSVSGSVCAQSFLNSQAGYFARFWFYLTRKGASGDMRVMLCETLPDGSPNMKAVLQQVTIPVASLGLGWNGAAFTPTVLDAGKRYAVMLVTAGNHYISMTTGNKYAQGTFFQSTDNAWFQGDLQKDINFAIDFCQFRSPRVEVQLGALELVGGIANVSILAQMLTPKGTSISWMVLVPGQGWIDLRTQVDADPHPFAGLNASLQFKAVLQGTTDLMPGFGVGANSRVITFRSRSDFRYISKVRTMPVPIKVVHLEVRLDRWEVARHTFTAKLLRGPLLIGGVGDVVELPDFTEEEPAPENTNAIIRRYVFNLPMQATAAAVAAGGTGYVVGNTITLSNGTILTVSSVSGGAVTGVTIQTAGTAEVGATPANPRPQVSTSGTGTGATFTITWTQMTITTFRWRFEGTTDNVLRTYHVEVRQDIEDPV